MSCLCPGHRDVLYPATLSIDSPTRDTGLNTVHCSGSGWRPWSQQHPPGGTASSSSWGPRPRAPASSSSSQSRRPVVPGRGSSPTS
eukprot:CAMPEP_0204341048 /NCGR_PEP_ID=MMETSP0469-20131031/23050_1 /ASSEMBLY_ACC=CAM_ASM_000384 /TAXON_ID=2969 /ORGANISM="Oxyrrhis marina" /LENGTH=85 /DNA_ID=CAMNT_0051325693 /DNA_START=57 /DNA_END=311 /DNA_ORIENTATION=+